MVGRIQLPAQQVGNEQTLGQLGQHRPCSFSPFPTQRRVPAVGTAQAVPGTLGGWSWCLWLTGRLVRSPAEPCCGLEGPFPTRHWARSPTSAWPVARLQAKQSRTLTVGRSVVGDGGLGPRELPPVPGVSRCLRPGAWVCLVAREPQHHRPYVQSLGPAQTPESDRPVPAPSGGLLARRWSGAQAGE